jgi:dipeptidyl aminopeptidase/acylaminoacyl peptidase
VEVEEFTRLLVRPGSGEPADIAELVVDASGRRAAFTATVFTSLETEPRSAIAVAELDTGEWRVLDVGDQDDRSPRWSPDGSALAFVSDRSQAGDFQTYLTDFDDEPSALAPVDGIVEYLSWSPDGGRLLLGVAGRGADIAGAQGGTTTASDEGSDLPEWVPTVETGQEANRWRRSWLIDLSTDEAQPISPDGLNVWETAWCGPDNVAAVVSPAPGEEAWYTAELVLINIASGEVRVMRRPDDQVGLPAGSPSGRWLAFVEAFCSDRGIVAGELRLLDVGSGQVHEIDVGGVDVTAMGWRDDAHLGYAGVRSPDTVIGEVDAEALKATTLWAESATTTAGWHPGFAPRNAEGSVIIAESYTSPPRIAIIGEGGFAAAASPVVVDEGARTGVGRSEPVRWKASDGLEIEGWLVTPEGVPPFPLIVDIHGGPVWAMRGRWLGRLRATPLLARRGYAVLYPNPRGSSGRGQEYARMVLGDMGGADTGDYLAGIDALVERGVADQERLGVTGISYGGFMSSWLITQDSRFRAAVVISPVSDWYSQHRTSQIPYFDALFLDDDPAAPGGRFHERSPAFHAAGVTTPTLILAGALDRNTPPGQALEMHRSLLEAGAVSELVTYPQDGHGIRRYPSTIDVAARIVDWFDRYLA